MACLLGVRFLKGGLCSVSRPSEVWFIRALGSRMFLREEGPGTPSDSVSRDNLLLTLNQAARIVPRGYVASTLCCARCRPCYPAASSHVFWHG